MTEGQHEHKPGQILQLSSTQATILASTSFTYTSTAFSTFASIITSASLTYTDYSILPIDVELSLEDPDAAQLGIQQPHQLMLSIVADATLERKQKLANNDGYTYNVKKQCVNATNWQCIVRPKVDIAFPENEQTTIDASVKCPSYSIVFFSFIRLTPVE